jgi:hypothetical protein
MLRFSEAGIHFLHLWCKECYAFPKLGMLTSAGVKTTCSIAIEKSVSMQGLKPPAPKVLKNRFQCRG